MNRPLARELGALLVLIIVLVVVAWWYRGEGCTGDPPGSDCPHPVELDTGTQPSVLWCDGATESAEMLLSRLDRSDCLDRVLQAGEEIPPPARLLIGADCGIAIVHLSGRMARLLGLPMDLNTATAQDLEALPGIGPKLAQRILDARTKAPFCSVDDLTRVQGIGAKTVAKLRESVAASCH